MDNAITSFFNNYISDNCLIFNDEFYKDLLEIKLNDNHFIDSINLGTNEKFDLISKISNNYHLDINKGLSYLKDKINLETKENEIKNLENKLDELISKVKYYQDEDINKIREDYNLIKSNLISYNRKNLDEKFNEFDILFEKVNKVIPNDNYVKILKRKFNQTDAWVSKYGTYDNNLVISKDINHDYENLKFKDLYSCSFLKNASKLPLYDQIFTPLFYNEQIFISIDGTSITCLDSYFNEKYTVKLNSNILTTGAIMFSQDRTLLFVLCDDGIKTVENGKVILTNKEICPYLRLTSDFKVAGFQVFNNYLVFGINSYDQNKSFIFKCYFNFVNNNMNFRKVCEDYLITGNIFIYYNYEKKLSIMFFVKSEDGYLINSYDLRSCDKVFDPISLDYAPMTETLTLKSGIKRVDTYITCYEEYVFYIAISENKDTYLICFNLDDKEYKQFKLDSSSVAVLSGCMVPQTNNICVYYDDSLKAEIKYGYKDNHKIQIFDISKEKCEETIQLDDYDEYNVVNKINFKFNNKMTGIYKNNVGYLLLLKNKIIGFKCEKGTNEYKLVVSE